MFCTHCGKEIEDDSIFCGFCGKRTKKSKTSELESKTKGGDQNRKPPNGKTTVLLNKFREIATAKGKQREKYQNLSSDAVWEVLDRFVINKLNDLTEKFKSDFDKQPYLAIENLKSTLSFLSLSGYWSWLAKEIIEKKQVRKARVKLDALISEWERVYLNFSNGILDIPEDVAEVLNIIYMLQEESIIDKNSSLKDLPKAVIDAIKEEFVHQVFYGYFLGVSECNLKTRGSE